MILEEFAALADHRMSLVADVDLQLLEGAEFGARETLKRHDRGCNAPGILRLKVGSRGCELKFRFACAKCTGGKFQAVLLLEVTLPPTFTSPKICPNCVSRPAFCAVHYYNPNLWTFRSSLLYLALHPRPTRCNAQQSLEFLRYIPASDGDRR